MPSRILVMYYSRSGHTRQVAQEVARELGADVEEISDRTERSGVRGYLRCGYEAFVQRLVDIRSAEHDPGAYDLVVVGTPVWGASVSSPVRSFLHRYQDRLRAVAFFCTCGGRGGERAFAQMSRVCGKEPVSTWVVRADELGRTPPTRFVREIAERGFPTREAAARGNGVRPGIA